MVKPYHLWLISETKPESPDEIHSSNQMIAWGLLSGFSKLPHVILTHCRTQPRDYDVTGTDWKAALDAQPPVDFTLVHSYTPAPIFEHMSLIRAKTSRQVMWMSELPYNIFDYSFTFLPCSGNGEQIPLPALCDVLNASMAGVKKLPGSVLLDHAWGWTDGSKCDGEDPNLWCNRLYQWLAPHKDLRVVAQLERPAHEEMAGITIPNWVRRVPGAFYPDYLRATAPYENFVMTHPGSYEHSIIDMAARGIRVLVPSPTVNHMHRDGWAVVNAGRHFAPQDTITRLGLPIFRNREEFLSLLNTPFDGSGWGKLCTDLPQMAARIDAHCQQVLNG
jgi:hypothetical protein